MSIGFVLTALAWAAAAAVAETATATAPSYRIVAVLTSPFRSHYAVPERVLLGLAAKGHQVTVYTPFPRSPARFAANLRQLDISACAFAADPLAAAGIRGIDAVAALLGHRLANVCAISALGRLSAASVAECAPLRRLLLDSSEPDADPDPDPDRRPFDLLLTETFDYDVTLAFAARLAVPFVAFAPNQLLPWHCDRLANPSNPAYVPSPLSGYAPPMHLGHRCCNAAVYALASSLYRLLTLRANDAANRALFGSDAPSLYDVVRRTSVLFANAHYSLNPLAPVVPSVVHISGANIEPAGQLPPDIERFINESKDGVVYFCMGSLLRSETFPEEKRNAFVHAFSKIPQRVLWKWEADELPEKSDNIMAVKWMPQRDVLAHPNIRLFISHGGLLGTSEAVYEGVPILGIPIFGDQRGNIKSIEANGAGELLDYHDITEEIVLEKVQRILNDPKYKENAKQLSERYRDRPMSPLDTAVYWIEYVIRHKGAPHLRTAAVDMPLYQYLLLDVIVFLLLVATCTFAAIYYACKSTFRLITKRSDKKPRKTSTKKEKAS